MSNISFYEYMYGLSSRATFDEEKWVEVKVRFRVDPNVYRSLTWQPKNDTLEKLLPNATKAIKPITPGSIARDEAVAMDIKSCQASLSECTAKNPMYCPYHGSMLIQEDITKNLTSAGIKGKVSVEMDQGDTKTGKGFSVTVHCPESQADNVRKQLQKFMSQPGITPNEDEPDLSYDKEDKGITAYYDIDVLKADKTPTKEDGDGAKDNEGYATIVDKKTGQKRLTNIASKKKGAALKEKQLKKNFIANEKPHGMMAYIEEHRALMGKPAKKKITNPKTGKTNYVYDDQIAGDALDNFFNGMTDAERKKWERRIFGTNKNSEVSGGDTTTDSIREYFGNPNMSIDDALSQLQLEYDQYEDFKKGGGKTSEQLHDEYLQEEARAREIMIDGDSYDIEDVEGNSEYDDIYNNAVVEVIEAGENNVRMFSQDALHPVKKNDIIRFDHSETEWLVDEDYDTKEKALTLTMAQVDDNPLLTDEEKSEMRGRRFMVTKDGWIELRTKGKENEPKNSKGTNQNIAGNENGGPREVTVSNGSGVKSPVKSESSKPNALNSKTSENVTHQATSSGAMSMKDAVKILGSLAYDKKTLANKLYQWEKNPSGANVKHREAAKLMLSKLEGSKKKPTNPEEW